jgi:hypothetical protein
VALLRWASNRPRDVIWDLHPFNGDMRPCYDEHCRECHLERLFSERYDHLDEFEAVEDEDHLPNMEIPERAFAIVQDPQPPVWLSSSDADDP